MNTTLPCSIEVCDGIFVTEITATRAARGWTYAVSAVDKEENSVYCVNTPIASLPRYMVEVLETEAPSEKVRDYCTYLIRGC